MKRITLMLFSFVILSGCAMARMQKMDESNAAYKACLANHPKKLSACEAERLSYEADQQAVLATKAGLFGTGATGGTSYRTPICNSFIDASGRAQSICQ